VGLWAIKAKACTPDDSNKHKRKGGSSNDLTTTISPSAIRSNKMNSVRKSKEMRQPHMVNTEELAQL
jgi:hypothetical protein